jgi:uncharacterized protein YihD (DUF1040 family)
MAECEQGWTGSLRDMDDEFMLYKFKVRRSLANGALPSRSFQQIF